jgi:hypothetical protein
MMLDAAINRELDQKVKCICAISNDKTIVRNDLKLIVKIIDNMDKRWGLWNFKKEYETAFAKDSNDQKAETLQTTTTTDDTITTTTTTTTTTPEDAGENPLKVKAKEYLKHLETLIEKNNGGELIKTEEPPQDDVHDSTKKEENDESNSASTTSKQQQTVKPETYKLELDEKASYLLDSLILYLRVIHSIDYYNATEYQQEHWMPNRCGVLHVRGSINKHDNSNQLAIIFSNSNQLNQLNTTFDSNQVRPNQVDDWIRYFEINVKPFVEYRDRVDDETAQRLGYRDVDTEIKKFIATNTQQIDKDKWLCPLSGKKFKGSDYVKKHIETKHAKCLEEVRKDVNYFNRFVLDPKRPYLPENPMNKNFSNNNNNNQQNQRHFNNNNNNNNIRMNNNFNKNNRNFNNSNNFNNNNNNNSFNQMIPNFNQMGMNNNGMMNQQGQMRSNRSNYYNNNNNIEQRGGGFYQNRQQKMYNNNRVR